MIRKIIVLSVLLVAIFFAINNFVGYQTDSSLSQKIQKFDTEKYSNPESRLIVDIVNLMIDGTKVKK